MPEKLNELLADGAAALVNAGFTGVNATWWWERRMGGGIEICQEFDPETASREISARSGHEVAEVRRIITEELGLEGPDPVVLTFEVSGETETNRVTAILAERSAKAEGLASGIYRRIEDVLEAG
jgi:hypothetical protein